MKDDWLLLQSAHWTIAVDPLGAQLSVLRDGQGRELLWNGDPAHWSGRAPVLFPIVDTLRDGRYGWCGEHYALPRHGLARTRRFDVARSSGNEALFRLRADAETLKVYPFHFELDLLFRLDGATLQIEAIARNMGDAPMPASLGFHPAFRWPLHAGPGGGARGAHFIEFAGEEPAPIRRLDASGLLTDVLHPTPVRGRRLALDDSLFRDDVVIFDQLNSRQLRYGTQAGPRLVMDFPDAEFLGLWTKPGAGFLCIEPWRGIADPVGFDGDLAHKPGMFTVQPGRTASLQMRLRVESD